MDTEIHRWDNQRADVGSYGCTSAETSKGNNAEDRHSQLFRAHAATQGPGYMNRVVVRHVGKRGR